MRAILESGAARFSCGVMRTWFNLTKVGHVAESRGVKVLQAEV